MTSEDWDRCSAGRERGDADGASIHAPRLRSRLSGTDLPRINPRSLRCVYDQRGMNVRPRTLTPHRLARLIGWARLWLSWLACALLPLIELNPSCASRITRVAARCAAALVLLKAIESYTPVKYPRCFGRRSGGSPGLRRLKGARLRRPCAGRSAVARFLAVLAQMRDFDAEVKRFRKRIASGLMRWRSTRYAWKNELLLAPPAPIAVGANTS